MSEYNSSEEFQRHSADVFARKEAEEQQKVVTSDKQRLQKFLDKYIEKHNSSVEVRAEATKKNREKGYQLDLSADIVEILTKIKSELG